MEWYYATLDREIGPLAEEDLHALARQGIIQPDTLVWTGTNPERTAYRQIAQPVLAGVTPSVPTAEARFCSQCGRAVNQDDMVRFGDQWVCAECKPAFAQRLREGAAPATTMAYAGFWRRFWAALVDGIIEGLAQFLVVSAIGIYGAPPNNPMALAVIPASLLINFAYETLFVYHYAATPGKLLLRVRVVTAAGGQLTLGRAAARSGAKLLSNFTLLIGYVIAAFDTQKRALHDHICSTRVIKLP